MKSSDPQSGFTPIPALLFLVIIGIIGFAGWKVYSSGHITNSAADTTVKSTMTKKESKAPQANTEYINHDFGIMFSYPIEWGSASIKQGDLVLPAHGDYRQITFDKNPKVDINFVTGGASSPLDGCPDPVYSQKHGLALERATLIGWDGISAILAYTLDYGALVSTNVATYNITKQPSTINGKTVWNKIRSNEKTLAFQFVNTEPVKASESCGDKITQQSADEANSYFKYIYFVRSFTTTKIKGVNAVYDARANKDNSVIDQTLVVLNSVKAL